jgi:hypothetical protein
VKVTLPVAVPTPGPEMVAVKVTGWPNALGLTDDVSVVVEVVLLTV